MKKCANACLLLFFRPYHRKESYDLQSFLSAKERSPRREKTRALYLDVEVANELEGRIQARKLVEENTPYNIEFIELLSDKHLEYEKESGTFELTEF